MLINNKKAVIIFSGCNFPKEAVNSNPSLKIPVEMMQERVGHTT